MILAARFLILIPLCNSEKRDDGGFPAIPGDDPAER